MNDHELKELCDVFMPLVEDSPERGMMALAKEAERTVRHNCMGMAYDLASRINNSNREDSKQ